MRKRVIFFGLFPYIMITEQRQFVLCQSTMNALSIYTENKNGDCYVCRIENRRAEKKKNIF